MVVVVSTCCGSSPAMVAGPVGVDFTGRGGAVASPCFMVGRLVNDPLVWMGGATRGRCFVVGRLPSGVGIPGGRGDGRAERTR